MTRLLSIICATYLLKDGMPFGDNGSQRSQGKSGMWPCNCVHSYFIKGRLVNVALGGDGG